MRTLYCLADRVTPASLRIFCIAGSPSQSTQPTRKKRLSVVAPRGKNKAFNGHK